MNAPTPVVADDPVALQRYLFKDFWSFMLVRASLDKGAHQVFRGYAPNRLGARAAARAQGYMNVRDMARVQNEKAQATAEEAAAATA